LTFVVYRRNVLVQSASLAKSTSHECPEHKTLSELAVNGTTCTSHFRMEKLLSLCPLLPTHKYNVLEQPPVFNDVTPPSPSLSSRLLEPVDYNQTPPTVTHNADVQIIAPDPVHGEIPNAPARIAQRHSGSNTSEQVKDPTPSCTTIVVTVDAITKIESGDRVSTCTNPPLQVANMTENALFPTNRSNLAVLQAVFITLPPECVDCLDCCKVTSPVLANSPP